jgi:hypothetical protein
MLKIDFCGHEAAKYACAHWHYAGCVPHSKLVPLGVWEDGRFIGCVIFGRGAASEIGSPFGLRQNKVCELVRIALREHKTPVSRILAIAVKLLQKQSPGLRLVVSFADTAQGHVGSVYQAANWLYLGAKAYHAYRVLGELRHPKSLYGKYSVGGQSVPWLRANVDPQAERIVTARKFKYVLPLDEDTRAAILPMALPYPKKPCAGSIENDARPYQDERAA